MRASLLSLLALPLLAGCPGDGSADAGNDVPAVDAPTLDTPAADAPTIDTPGPTDAPASDAAGISVEIRDFVAFGNCMPIVPADPIVATWTVAITGASGSTATFESGRLMFTGGEMVPVTVDVPTFPLTGGAATQAQRRNAAVTKTNGCSLCSMGARLEATYLIDGASFPVVANDNYECAF